jgi:hypothetical protein
MALPIYRKRGIMYADLPRVETASLKEGARGFESIDRKLDQLSSFIKREGTQYAKEQAMAYAAQNPVTEQQIAEAVASEGEGKSWLSALTGGNVYDETLQAAQGSMLANQLSIEAQKKFRELQVMAENNQLSFDDAQIEIQDIIDGYATTISAFSPEASLKARASMATAGNGVLKSVAEKQSKIFAAAQAAKLDQDMMTVRRFAEDEFARGDSWNPTTQTYIRAEDRIQAIFEPIESQALAMGQEGRFPKLLDAKRQARVNGVTQGLLDERFAASPLKAYQKVINGQLGDYESSWAVMTDDDRGKVKQKMLKEIADRRGIREKLEKDLIDGYKGQAVTLQMESFTASRDRQREIATQLTTLNSDAGELVTPVGFITKLSEGKLAEKIDNGRLMFQLRDSVDDGVLDSDAIEYLASNEQINWTQAEELQDRIAKNENAEIRQALRLGKAEVDKLDLPSQQKAQAKASLTSDLLKASEDPSVDLNQLVAAKVKEQEESIANKKAQMVVDRVASSLSKSVIFAGDDDDKVQKRTDMARQIIENITLLDQIEGLPDNVKASIKEYLRRQGYSAR